MSNGDVEVVGNFSYFSSGQFRAGGNLSADGVVVLTEIRSKETRTFESLRRETEQSPTSQEGQVPVDLEHLSFM